MRNIPMQGRHCSERARQQNNRDNHRKRKRRYKRDVLLWISSSSGLARTISIMYRDRVTPSSSQIFKYDGQTHRVSTESAISINSASVIPMFFFFGGAGAALSLSAARATRGVDLRIDDEEDDNSGGGAKAATCGTTTPTTARQTATIADAVIQWWCILICSFCWEMKESFF